MDNAFEPTPWSQPNYVAEYPLTEYLVPYEKARVSGPFSYSKGREKGKIFVKFYLSYTED